MSKILAYLGLGQAGALLSFLNRMAAILDKWFDEHLRQKHKAEGRAELTAESNKHVYEQLDSARKTKADVSVMTEEQVDEILDRGITR
jgi:hypothetical protein